MASDKQTRREWLSAVPGAAAVASTATAQTAAAVNRPNIVLVISDQFRWDCIGAMGLNPMNLTPNLDQMAARGVLFRQAISNQPVCAPARASIFTGQYPGKHGVWKNALGLREDATTLATVMKQAGYSTNYIGKWHLARPEAGTAAETRGAVKAGHRGGFADLWEAANALEWTSHAYQGDPAVPLKPAIAADLPTCGKPPTPWSGRPTPMRATSSIPTTSPSISPIATAPTS